MKRDWVKSLGSFFGIIVGISTILAMMGILPWASLREMQGQGARIARDVSVRIKGVNDNVNIRMKGVESSLQILLQNQEVMRTLNQKVIVKIVRIETNMKNAREDLHEIKADVKRYQRND